MFSRFRMKKRSPKGAFCCRVEREIKFGMFWFDWFFFDLCIPIRL